MHSETLNKSSSWDQRERERRLSQELMRLTNSAYIVYDGSSSLDLTYQQDGALVISQAPSKRSSLLGWLLSLASFLSGSALTYLIMR